MALFLRNALSEENLIFQNDKSQDKKFYCGASIQQDITINAVSAVSVATLFLSTPLNAQNVKLNNIFYNKNSYMVTAALTTIKISSDFPIWLPWNNLKVFIGISDQNLQNITTLTQFATQNHISIPLLLDTDENKISLQPIYDAYKLTNNQTFLNFFIESTLNTNDYTNMLTDINAFIANQGGASTISSYSIFHNIVIAGHCH